LSYLPSSRAPEAEVAVAAFEAVQSNLQSFLSECISGQELIARGFAEDVRLASELNASTSSPRLSNGAYIGSQ